MCKGVTSGVLVMFGEGRKPNQFYKDPMFGMKKKFGVGHYIEH
jgi:hypothetical protein